MENILEYFVGILAGGFLVFMCFKLKNSGDEDRDEIRLERYAKMMREKDENRSLSLPKLIDKANKLNSSDDK